MSISISQIYAISSPWVSHMAKYFPLFASNFLCVPVSTIVPSPKTKITSASLIVDSRCATATVVRPSAALSSAACTILSDSVSSADVASSRSKSLGLRINARAMAMRCFWPPENWRPREPQRVFRPSGRAWMKSQAFACLQASMIWSSVAGVWYSMSSIPRAILSRTDPWKRVGSCCTSEIWLR